MTRSTVRGFLLAFALTSLGGCAATVGDPCTAPADCGSGLCLNLATTPGGYCSKQCLSTDAESCPSGTVCVQTHDQAISSVCFRECSRDEDCRAGYTCRQDDDWPRRICIGPGEL
jgi:hypothetical protein